MAKQFHLTIARVGENVFDGDVEMVTAPGSEGFLTILADHEALVATLQAGTIAVKSASGAHTFELTSAGVLEVSNGQATILE